MKLYVFTVDVHLRQDEMSKAVEYLSQSLKAVGIEDPKVVVLPRGMAMHVEEV